MNNTKNQGMDFEDWLDEYREALAEYGCDYWEVDECKRLYNKGFTPQRAAKDDADFMMNG